MKEFVKKLLKKQSAKILAKYNPKVIGITGSIGKTSTKNATLAVLDQKFNVRASVKNYNNEFGVPLTIIGVESPGKSAIGWFMVLLKSFWMLAVKDKNYPNVLLLEMGADKVGDIKYLVEMAQCDVGVLTNIGPSHLENFTTIDKVIREKRQIVTHLRKDGFAIMNIDNEHVMSVKDSVKAQVLTFGFDKNADVGVIELETSGKGMEVDGIKFKLTYNGSAVPIYLPSVVGKNAIVASLSAAAVGVAMGMNLVDISEGLKNFKTPPGRMKLIPGIKKTLLIDDTYNASPESTIAGLEVLSRLEVPDNAQKFAVLGNMLELGSYTEEGHAEVGRKVVELGVDTLITVGEFGQMIANAAQEAGMDKDHIFTFDYSPEAGKFLQDRMQQGDLILIKGSQGVRMEKIVKEVMAEPLKAGELLVRQGAEWK